MRKAKKKNGDEASEGLTGQQMLMRITNAYIDAATTDEQRRMIYEYTMKVLCPDFEQASALKKATELHDEET